MNLINYKDLVVSAKKAAKDVLRAEKVQNLLGYIANVNESINFQKKAIERHEKELARDEYALRIATQFESPDLETITKTTEEARTYHSERITSITKEITELEAKVEEYNTKIEKWNNGTSETKLSLDLINSMAATFVKNKIGNDFNLGLYTEAAKENN